MGREAVCFCSWGELSADCRVVLENDALLVREMLRGPLRREAPLAAMRDAVVDGERLLFRVNGEAVSLGLGAKAAESWRKKLTAAPVTLAAKLGLKAGMRAVVLGTVESEALVWALADIVLEAKAPELIVICAERDAELERDLRRATAFGDAPAIWIVYRKGAKSELGEGAIRVRMRGMGWMDVKVAAVDSVYTALRFVRRGE
jgi:hypothetical protein